MTYFFMLLAVFFMAFLVGTFLVQSTATSRVGFFVWSLAFASCATFLFHHLH